MHVSLFRVLGPARQVLEYVLPYRNMATTAVKRKINFNTKHLKTGDPDPPYNGKLRIYNMRFCPYAQRTILALIAKKIDYEVVNVDLVNKPEWLTKKSAFNKVPALEIKDGVTVYESLVTVEYLDDVYPERPLLPKDPVKKAHDKIVIEAIEPVHRLFYKSLRSPETIKDSHVEAYINALDFLQEQLKVRGTKFFDGEQPGYADYMIWPWFERITGLIDELPRMKTDPQRFTLFTEYLKNMEADPTVQEYLVPKEIMTKFVEGYKLKPPNPNYDILYKGVSKL